MVKRINRKNRLHAQQRGFTLIEVLVALVIAATAAAVILSQVRSLMLRAEKAQAHQLAVLQLLNDSLRLAYTPWPADVATQLDATGNHLTLVLDGATQEELPPVDVHNFVVGGAQLPPVAFAYTTFQLFSVRRDRYTLHAIRPALKPPAAAQGDANLTNAPAPPDTGNAAPPAAAATENPAPAPATPDASAASPATPPTMPTN